MAPRAAARALGLALAFLLAGCAQPIPADDPASSGGEGAQLDGGASGGGDPTIGGGGDAGAGGSGPAGGGGGGGTGPGPSSGSGPTGGPSGPGGEGMPSDGDSASSGGTGVKYSVPRSVHEAAWLCQTAVTVDDYTAAGTDDQQCKVTLTFTGSTVTAASTGIPNHDYESGSGCCTKTQSMTNTFPLEPEMASSPTYPSQRGSIATAVNGVAIFGPEDSNGEDVVIVTYSSPTAQPRLETCDAHSEPNSGTYHYHADGNCIHWHPGSGESMLDYDFSKVDSTTHSKIIGFAPDGFPIYGSDGYGDDGQTIQEVTSSYRLKEGADGSNGQEDQEYVEGLGDLDECNGRVGPTPEFPDGIYHYYSTKHNGEGDWGFPYFPLCYWGVVSSSGGGMTGGSGGGMPPSGGSTTSSSTSGSMTGSPPPSGGGTSSTSSCQPPPPGTSPTGPPPPGCPPPPPP